MQVGEIWTVKTFGSIVSNQRSNKVCRSRRKRSPPSGSWTSYSKYLYKWAASSTSARLVPLIAQTLPYLFNRWFLNLLWPILCFIKTTFEPPCILDWNCFPPPTKSPNLNLCSMNSFVLTKSNSRTELINYLATNGPSEFHVIGSLKQWDIRPELGKINVPTLLVSGQYDEATPEMVREVNSLIPGSTWELFPESSHTPHLEEPARFKRIVNDWLDKQV